MVTSPYHKLDCSLISDGGAAFILTSAEQAKELGIEKPIYILGGGECYTHEHIFLMPSLTVTGAVESSRLAYEMAGYRAADMDVAGVYDCFTGTVIMMLEDLGFCPKGEGGRFVADGQMTYGGTIPSTPTAACSRSRIPASRDRCFISMRLSRNCAANAANARCRARSSGWCTASVPASRPMQRQFLARGTRCDLGRRCCTETPSDAGRRHRRLLAGPAWRQAAAAALCGLRPRAILPAGDMPGLRQRKHCASPGQRTRQGAFLQRGSPRARPRLQGRRSLRSDPGRTGGGSAHDQHLYGRLAGRSDLRHGCRAALEKVSEEITLPRFRKA